MECQTVTVEQAAQMLGIGRNSAYEAVRTGELPALRIGRRVVIPRAAIERMLATAGTRETAGPDQPAAA